MSFSLNLKLTEKRAKEIANLKTDQARTHALNTHEWEDKIYDAISTVWDAAISLDAHGFTNYDADYLVFALNRFQKEFEYEKDRDRKTEEHGK